MGQSSEVKVNLPWLLSNAVRASGDLPKLREDEENDAVEADVIVVKDGDRDAKPSGELPL